MCYHTPFLNSKILIYIHWLLFLSKKTLRNLCILSASLSFRIFWNLSECFSCTLIYRNTVCIFETVLFYSTILPASPSNTSTTYHIYFIHKRVQQSSSQKWNTNSTSFSSALWGGQQNLQKCCFSHTQELEQHRVRVAWRGKELQGRAKNHANSRPQTTVRLRWAPAPNSTRSHRAPCETC